MRGVVAKEVRQAFERMICTSLPEFTRMKGEGRLPRGRRPFEWRMSASLSAFVEINFAQYYDNFTIDCAWSMHARFPFVLIGCCPVDYPQRGISKDEPVNGEYAFRLGNLWAGPKEDVWWHVGKPGTDEMGPCLGVEVIFEGTVEETVCDAIERIRKYAIPYFVHVAKEQSQ